MPRFAKQATRNPGMVTPALDDLVRVAKAEVGHWAEVEQGTRLVYEQNARKLSTGWDLAAAAKGSRYVMRAAGLWTMRRDLKRALRTAEKVRKKGMTGEELQPVREAMFAREMQAVAKQLEAIAAFTALPWNQQAEKLVKKQKPHKQKAATDAALEKFYAAAAKSSFLVPIMVAEFSGVRGAEFGAGVRLELTKVKGVPTLNFFIQSAKSDGLKKGIELRCVASSFPSEAAPEVQRRWLNLAKLVPAGKSYVVSIDPTAKQTPGQRFTQACKFIGKKANVDTRGYGLRHRLSAQVKESSGGDAVAVALALGHQTTETQRHYARASRGGGGVSPVQVVGVNVAGHVIRGATCRTGPNHAQKERVQLRAAVAAAPPASVAPRPRGPRL